MSVLRTARCLPVLARQCARLAPVSQTQHRGYAAEAEMAFTFASPAKVYYNKAVVRQVDVPSSTGNFGILASHVPVLAVLKPGVVTVLGDDGTKKFFVSSGSVTVNEDSSVQILAEEACELDSLDSKAIQDGLHAATQELTTAGTEQAKAEAQIAMECYEAMDKALQENK